MRQGSAPNFCPPTEEGITLIFEDEENNQSELEFLGLLFHNDRRYGFFFPIDEENPAGSSGEIVILEATEMDEEDQPVSFELLEDASIAAEVYEAFKVATKDLYDFE